MGLSDKSDFNDFTLARTNSDGGDFYFGDLLDNPLHICHNGLPDHYDSVSALYFRSVK